MARHPGVRKGRHYDFALPLEVSGAKVIYGKESYSDLFARLPASLRAKADQVGFFDTLTVEKSDLDQIDDATWAEFRSRLGV